MYYWYFMRLLELKKTLFLTIEMLSIQKEIENNLYGAFGARLESSNFHVAIRFFFCLFFIIKRVKSYL